MKLLDAFSFGHRVMAITAFAFMAIPAVAFYRIWPLPDAITSGTSILFVAIIFGYVWATGKKNVIYTNAGVYFFFAMVSVLVFSIYLNKYGQEASWRWYLVALFLGICTIVSASELKSRGPKSYSQTLAAALWVGSLLYTIVSLLKYYGVVHYFIPFIEPSVGRLSGVWEQPNLTTTMCWLGFASGIYLSRNGMSGKLWCLSLFLFGWTIACAASRMSWLMVVSLVALALFCWLPRYTSPEAKGLSVALLKGCVAIVLMVVLVPFVNGFIQEYLVSTGWLDRANVVAVSDRQFFDQNARLFEFSKILSVPNEFSLGQWFVGVGPGNYSTFSYQVDMKVAPQEPGRGVWLHSHNIFTMIFVEFGALGLMAFLTFLVCLVLHTLKNRMSGESVFFLASIGILFLHSNLEFPLWNFWFFILACLLVTGFLDYAEVELDLSWFKRTMSFVVPVFLCALLVNVAYQYFQISAVATKGFKDKKDYETLTLLANDSLMGPYAVLRKYMDFAPEALSLEWQLKEARRMKEWQARDLVVLREFSLLVLMSDLFSACKSAEALAFRYPYSSTIMIEHSAISGKVDQIKIEKCVQRGLSRRGQTLSSMREEINKVMRQ